MRKVTVKAPSDIALIKYWGKKDEVLRLPENGSLSMVLDGVETVTTVEFDPSLTQDEITIQGEQDAGEAGRVSKHLDRIRKLAKVETKAKVVSQNTFPRGTGLSSSGSGFAALTVAAAKALELELSTQELSILARQGSGTACRCVCDGFVEWKDGDTSETSYSETIFPKDHWDIRDVVVVVDEGRKLVSSTEGHATAQSSPFFAVRQSNIGTKLQAVKQAIAQKDFTTLGTLVEAEALEFHTILLTSTPSLIAWYPGTVEVMLAVRNLRALGIEAYFTINTGFNVHVLTLPEHQAEVAKALIDLPSVKKIIHAKVGNGPEEQEQHLF